MNQSSSSSIGFQSNRATFVALVASMILAIAISIFCLSFGYFKIFQNLFYIPIIIACVYYTKRGFAFSVVIAGIYFFLTILFTRESTILLEALIRVFIFVLIAGLIAFLSSVPRRAAEMLRESEKKFKDTIETVSDWVWEVDEKGQYTYSNPGIKDLLGYEASEVLGKTPFDLMPKDEAEKMGKVFGEIIQKKEHFSGLENWNVRKNGTKILLETSGTPLLDGKGNLIGYRGIDRDITGRKKTEEILKESEEKFSMLFEYAPDAYSMHDKDGNFVDVNKSFEKLVGYRRKEVIGKSFSELKLLSESEIRKTFSDTIGGVLGKSTGTGEFTLNRKDGSKIIVETRAVPIKIKDETIMLIIERDISERKRAELELQSKVKELNEAQLILQSLAEDIQKEKESVGLKVTERTRELRQEQAKLVASINSLSLGFLLLDLNDKILLKNPAVGLILGIPESEVTVDRIKKYFEGIVNLEACHNQCVTEKKTVKIKDVAKGNKFLSLLLVPVIMLKDSEEVIGHILLIEDITEQKLLDQMRTEIVSTTSHQLRTPLSVIKGNLEMLLAGDFGKIEKKQKEVLQEAFLGNERMIKLVNGLMDVSKISEGKLELKLVPRRLEELVAESVKELIPFAEKNNASLSYAPPSIPLPEVNVDSGRIKQLLQNLIENAIKYRRLDTKGKVLVEIKKDKTGKFLETSVKDNGAGIPKAEQKKVFERFFRASNVIRMDPGGGAGPGGGTGLGLYIANAVIEQSGGKLWFESEGEDKGTTFYFKLPIKK